MKIGKQGRIVFSDNMDSDLGVPSLEDESVALTFTSPPYFNYIEYEGGNGLGNCGETYDDYLHGLVVLFKEVFVKTLPGGWAIMNVTNMKSRTKIEGKSFMYPLVSDVISLMSESGFIFFDEAIWRKSGIIRSSRPLFGSYPYPSRPRISNSNFESILVFLKDGRRKVDSEIKELSKLSWDLWKVFTDGVWEIHQNTGGGHPAMFPMEMAERIVRLYSFVDDIVLDPFVGTGTTVIASDLWDRKGLGYEIASEYKGAIQDRVAKYLNKQLEIL